MLKRTFDICAATMLLILLAPLMAIIAVCVRLDSSGPAFFRQTRVGRHGNRFTILKFRSMTVGSTGPLVTTASDQRITRLGRALRASKLDELPQLINIVRGDMSVVGPRPEVPHLVAAWDDETRRAILSVRPGLTCLASVEFRNEAELIPTHVDTALFYRHVLMPAKNALSRKYVAEMSLWLDLKIILHTVAAVAAGSRFGRVRMHMPDSGVSLPQPRPAPSRGGSVMGTVRDFHAVPQMKAD